MDLTWVDLIWHKTSAPLSDYSQSQLGRPEMISQFSKSIVKLTGKIHQHFLGTFFQQKVVLLKWLFSVTCTLFQRSSLWSLFPFATRREPSDSDTNRRGSSREQKWEIGHFSPKKKHPPNKICIMHSFSLAKYVPQMWRTKQYTTV